MHRAHAGRGGNRRHRKQGPEPRVARMPGDDAALADDVGAKAPDTRPVGLAGGPHHGDKSPGKASDRDEEQKGRDDRVVAPQEQEQGDPEKWQERQTRDALGIARTAHGGDRRGHCRHGGNEVARRKWGNGCGSRRGARVTGGRTGSRHPARGLSCHARRAWIGAITGPILERCLGGAWSARPASASAPSDGTAPAPNHPRSA